MNVLSLFDGISCGQIALERANIHVDHYFASEIDKHAIKVTMANYPNTIQLGSVVNVRGQDLPAIDLLIGGSPCQGFSFAGKQLNFEDPRSKLFFEFVRLLKEVKPKYFLLENVKMKQEFQDVISDYLGVKPVEINSALVSAQNRKRLYWTNIPIQGLPDDKGIMLPDIVLEGDFPEYECKDDRLFYFLEKEVERGKVGYFGKDAQANRVYYLHGKSITLMSAKTKMGHYLFGVLTPDRREKGQNGQRFNDGKKFYTLTAQDRHGIFKDGIMRRLLPVECERLQTVPEQYTSCVSEAQRYKMLGNGWTVDVIAWIFKHMSAA